VSNGGVGAWSTYRVHLSRFATRLANPIAGHEVRDPMSGFFMMKQDYSRGFNILLDIIMSSPRALRLLEVPYVFSERQHGESKIEPLVHWEYVYLLLDQTAGRVVPVLFLLLQSSAVSGFSSIWPFSLHCSGNLVLTLERARPSSRCQR
jgi:dolichol-phosphate mannosyltransferase